MCTSKVAWQPSLSPHSAAREIKVDNLLVSDEMAIRVVHQDLGVVHFRAESSGERELLLEQRLVAPELIKPAAGANGQIVFLAGGEIVVDVGRRFRRLVVVVVHAALLDHAKARVEIELAGLRVHDARLCDPDGQTLLVAAHAYFLVLSCPSTNA